jgi:hypothetical protein
MSDGNDNKVADESRPSPVQQPTPAPAPASQPPLGYPNVPQQVACPTCSTIVAVGTAFCPQCGSPIPSAVPPAWPGIQPAPAPKRNVALIVGIILIAIIVIGIGGYAFYQNQQQLVLQAAKSSEKDAANQSINQLQATCFSNRTDVSNLSYSNGVFYGYMTVYETFGISNPTRFAMSATWTLTFDFPGPSWVLTDTQTFHLVANGIGYPTFAFRLTGNQLTNLTNSTSLKTFTATVHGSYLVTGTYATYTVTQHSTYNSSSNTGTGTIGSSGSQPKC